MAITEIAYCARESVQRALNIADTPRLNQRVDDAVMAGARTLERELHRKFYPETKTVLFDQPDGDNLWLYENELAAAPTQVLSGGDAMTSGADFFARPKSGPPYGWLEASYAGDVFWQSVDTPQAAISITGEYNYPVNKTAVTTLGASITNSAATLTLADSSQVGIGSLILVDTERLLVSDKAFASTTVTLSADLASSKSAGTFIVSNGALLNQGELILIDGERMFIETIAGNSVTVDRAVNASTLAAHTTGTTIYAPRTATVLRAVTGTTAASHNSAAVIYALRAPSLIREYNLALAINNVSQALGAYARTLGAGDTQRDNSGAGVAAIAAQAYAAYGRKARGRAV